MNYFEEIFKQKLDEFTKDKRLYETPIVRFIEKLRKDKLLNKPIKIPVINTDFDNNELIIEYDGNLYTWHIEDKYSNEVERAKDKFSTLDLCLKDLGMFLRNQVIKESFPNNKNSFGELSIEELDKFLDDDDITDMGQFTKEQKQWLYSQVKKGKLFRGRDKLLPKLNTMYSKYELGLNNDFLPIDKK